MNAMRARLARGAVWLTATRVLVNLLSFATTVLLARLLVPADFGLVALATTVITVLASVTEMSMSSALIQHAGPERGHFDSAFTLNLGRALLVALLIAAVAVPVSRLYGDDRLAGIMLATGAVTLAGGLLNPKLAVLSRNLVFWQEFVIGVAQRVASAVISVAVALVWHSYWALIIGNAALQLSAVVLSYVVIPYRPRFRLVELRELLSFSVWLTLGQAVNTINWKSDHLAIGFFLGSAPLGFYSMGDTLAVLPTREATTPIAQTLFPGFARLTDDPGRLRRAYQRAQAFLCAVALPVGFGFAIVSKPLILLTMGPAWMPSVVIVQLLSSIFALQALSSTLQPVAMALGDTQGLFKRDLLNLVVRLPLIAAGLTFGGFLGIVYARFVSGILSNVINMMMVRRLLGLTLREQLAANSHALASVAVMSVAMIAVGDLVQADAAGPTWLASQVAVLTFTGALTYVGTLYALWRLAGRPVGPEREIGELIQTLRLAL